MNIYIYYDNDKGEYENGVWTAPKVFAVEAKSISEADVAFEKKVGQNPQKMKNIGCTIWKE
jgi:hypothetical protein